LNKVNRLDWELYWMQFSMNCLLQIAQAAYKACTAHGRVYNRSVFAEATVGGILPFFSDSFDTLRDLMFAGLCFQSNKLVLQVIGIASWMYLAVIHLILLRDEAHVMELQANCASVLVAPSKHGSITPEESINHARHLIEYPWYGYYVKPIVILVKQTTPSKRRILMLENAVQAVGALVYASLEGGGLPFPCCGTQSWSAHQTSGICTFCS